MWYLLLNNSMNYVAKNIFWLMENKKRDLLKHVNSRITEEIIQRTCKYLFKKGFPRDLHHLIQYLKKTRKVDSISKSLQKEKKILKKKLEDVQEDFFKICLKVNNYADLVKKQTKKFLIMGYEWKIKSKLVKDADKRCKLNIMLHYFGCS